jgi:hypothetical protein
MHRVGWRAASHVSVPIPCPLVIFHAPCIVTGPSASPSTFTGGEFEPLRAWLGDKVHSVGSRESSMDALLNSQFGEPLNPEYYLAYLESKYSQLYGLGAATMDAKL